MNILFPGRFVIFLTAFFSTLPFFVLGAPIYISPDGNDLFVAHGNGKIEIWDQASGSLSETFQLNSTLMEEFETDGTNLYVGTMEGELLVLDSTGNISMRINVSEFALSSLAINQDSRLLYTGSYDNIIRVWDMRDWSLVKEIEEHKLPVNKLVLDGNYLYSASGDASVKIWDKHTMTLIKTLTTHSDWRAARMEKYPIWEMLIVDNKVYTGHVSGSIRIWDLTTDSLIKEIQAHSSDVTELITDGQYIYSGGASRDKTVKIWTLEGDRRGPVLNVGSAVGALAVDSDYLYVGVREGGVLVYDKSDWNLSRKLGNFTQDYTPELSSNEEEQSQLTFNPVLLVVFVLVLVLIAALILETYTSVKKKHDKLGIREIGNHITSSIGIGDVLKILAVSSIIIFFMGLINTAMVFPQYIPNIQVIYYFDVLVRNGAFLPIWFLLLPSLAYWVMGRHRGRTRYLTSVVILAFATLIYMFAPGVV